MLFVFAEWGWLPACELEPQQEGYSSSLHVYVVYSLQVPDTFMLKWKLLPQSNN